MKIALISDVHANLPALEAALSDVRAEGVDENKRPLGMIRRDIDRRKPHQ
ncbi:MAG: metallophosphatase family protein [Anaerolineales bacterium]|jgi:hypothetical protein|nr:metallophosphatase family protein [Anaerolineales bacterium]MCZ7549258.1 metallophosphatase family protein [Anaerolineales bacterium]MDX9938070.1 hypothetical protein [Anaerolineales bacterium]GER81301.1 hypothetical protein DIM_33820 [Candidatus Denitrolinea symbiosum]